MEQRLVGLTLNRQRSGETELDWHVGVETETIFGARQSITFLLEVILPLFFNAMIIPSFPSPDTRPCLPASFEARPTVGQWGPPGGEGSLSTPSGFNFGPLHQLGAVFLSDASCSGRLQSGLLRRRRKRGRGGGEEMRRQEPLVAEMTDSNPCYGAGSPNESHQAGKFFARMDFSRLGKCTSTGRRVLRKQFRKRP